MMVKWWVLQSELQTEETSGVVNDQDKSYLVASLREVHFYSSYG